MCWSPQDCDGDAVQSRITCSDGFILEKHKKEQGMKNYQPCRHFLQNRRETNSASNQQKSSGIQYGCTSPMAMVYWFDRLPSTKQCKDLSQHFVITNNVPSTLSKICWILKQKKDVRQKTTALLQATYEKWHLPNGQIMPIMSKRRCPSTTPEESTVVPIGWTIRVHYDRYTGAIFEDEGWHPICSHNHQPDI